MMTRIMRYFFCLLLALALCCSAEENETTTAPTFAPAKNETTVSPTTAPPGNETIAPTPANATSTPPTVSPVPTIAPTPSNATTPSPTMPANATTTPPSVSPVPTIAPTPSNATTPSPTKSPTNPPTPAKTPAPSKDYIAPTSAPTTKKPDHHKKHSVWRILGKTLAWLIIIALSVLLFGAIMSNRYRIYYYVKSAWYAFLRWEGFQWLIRKLRLERFFGGQESSLNGIIFENDLQEGLLMQDA